MRGLPRRASSHVEEEEVLLLETALSIRGTRWLLGTSTALLAWLLTISLVTDMLTGVPAPFGS